MRLLWTLAFGWGLLAAGLGAITERVALHPNNVLVDFLAYRHIAILHYKVPENALSVAFKFVAKEVKLGGILECYPRDVTINIKSGSIPLVRPDGSRIEAKLLENRRRNYTVEATSNGDEHVVNIVAPPPGDWYAIAYRSWYDPNDGHIKQQGLAASCDTILDSEMSVELAERVEILGEKKNNQRLSSLNEIEPSSPERSVQLSRQADSAMLQYRLPDNTERASLSLRSSCAEECVVSVHVTASDHLLGGVINSSEASFGFRAEADGSVHYVSLRLETGSASNLTIELEPEPQPDYLSEVKLTRRSLPEFFSFDYEHLPGNATKALPMNLTVGNLTVLRFELGPILDIGGSLSVGLRLAEQKPKEDDEEEEDEDKESAENVVIIGCLSLGYHASISPRGGCVRGVSGQLGGIEEIISRADIYSANRSSPGFVHVPYPEPGTWHLSLRAFHLLHGNDSTTCSCFESCARQGVNCSATEECECAREWEAEVESSVGSSPCIENACGPHGRCLHYMSGGLVFSACHCSGGYRGFDCADDAYVVAGAEAYVQLGLLTLSNIAFVAAITAAVRRHYYTEAVIYAAVMFFSTFYHACEAGEEGHSFCLMKLSVLQFCDFYNALLSIWVTLVAMAALGKRTTSFCQMIGVVVLAVGAEMDRTALWVFLLPAFFGCGLVVVSWALKCRQKGTLAYPARVYRLVYLPIGLTIVFAGLICYAFLQTRKNYYILHSLWHVCVALGAALLLPKREYMQ